MQAKIIAITKHYEWVSLIRKSHNALLVIVAFQPTQALRMAKMCYQKAGFRCVDTYELNTASGRDIFARMEYEG